MDRKTLKKQIKEFEHTTELAVALLIATLLATGVAYGSIGSGDLTSSQDYLIAEYRFDTGAGNTGYDTAGNNDGTLQNLDFDGDSGWTSGIRGKALEFDGSDDYVSITDSASLDIGTDGLTVGGWIYLREDSDSNKWMLFDKGTSQSGTYYLYNDGNNFRMTVKDGSNRYDATASSSIVPQNQWVFVVGTYDESEASLWMNGEKVASTSAPANLGSNSKPVWIGEYQGGGYELDGKVDSARIYSTALNKSQIKSLYNSGSWRIGTTTSKDDPSKVLDISFQHQNSTHVLDTSGYSNHGQPKNGASQEDAVKCKVGRCYSFDGSNDFVDVPGDSVPATEEITVSFWQKGVNQPTDDSTFEATDANKNRVMNAHVPWRNGDIYWDFGDDNNDRISTNLPSKYYTGWHHYSFVANNNTGRMAIYVDGKLLYEESHAKGLSSPPSQFAIGSYAGGNNRHFRGRIDQFKVYDKALTQSEIIKRTQGLSSSGAVLEMRFNRNGGDRFIDYSGEKNHGTLQPNASYGPDWVEGLRGQALEFDGSGDYVSAPTLSQLDEGTVTVSAWVKSYGSTGTRQTVVSAGESSSTGTVMALSNGDSKMHFWVHTSSGWTDVTAPSIFNQWVHMTGVYDGKELKLYVNGELKNTVSVSGAMDTPTRDTSIGARNSDDQNWFNGKIDNVRVYPYAVSRSKVHSLYNRDKSLIGSDGISNKGVNLQKGLLLSQTFNRIETCGQSDTVSCPSGMNGKVAVDESGEANHGELVNGPTERIGAQCKLGQCLSFDGDNDHVNAGNIGLLDNSDVATWSAWIYPTGNYGAGGSWGTIIESRDGGLEWWVGTKNDGRLGYWGQGENSGSSTPVILSKNEWQHVAFVKRSNGDFEYYLNGNLEDTQTNTATYSVDGDTIIGEEKDGSDPFDGKIDQVRVYNRSLSKKETWKLYTRGRDRQGGMAGAVGWWRLGVSSPRKWDSVVDWNASGSGGLAEFEDKFTKIFRAGTMCEWENHGDFIRWSEAGCGDPSEMKYVKDLPPNYGELKAKIEFKGSSYEASGVSFYAKAEDGSLYNLTCEDDSEVPDDGLSCPYSDGGTFTFNSTYTLDAGEELSKFVVASEMDDCCTDGGDSSDLYELDISVNHSSFGFAENHHGEIVGNPKQVEGKTGKALKFDGSDDYVLSTGSSPSQLDNYSISVWFKFDDASTNTYPGIVSTTDSSGSEDYKQGVTFQFYDNSGYYLDAESATIPNCQSGGGHLPKNPANTIGQGISYNTWHHATLVNKRGKEVILYVDGKVAAKETNPCDNPTDTSRIQIGARYYNGGVRQYFDGKIDDVRIYPYALSGEQVRKVMNGGGVSVGG